MKVSELPVTSKSKETGVCLPVLRDRSSEQDILLAST